MMQHKIKTLFIPYITIIVTFIISIPYSAYTQNGNYMINNYTPNNAIDIYNWSVSQDKKGIVYTANKQGIIAFDGKNWDIVSDAVVPLNIYTTKDGEETFIASNNAFGVIRKTISGESMYHEIAKNKDFGTLNKIYEWGAEIIIISDKCLVLVNKSKSQIYSHIPFPKGVKIKHLVFDNGNIYAISKKERWYEFDTKSHEFKAENLTQPASRSIFSISAGERTFIGYRNNTIYEFKNKKFSLLKIAEQEYINNNILSSACAIDNKTIAISTLIGGVAILPIKDTTVKTFINYYSGLADDEVFSMSCRDGKNLWLSHELGVSLVELKTPFRSYSHYPGLEGYPTDIEIMNNTVYVSTSKGIFWLDSANNNQEVELIIEKVKKTLEEPTLRPNDSVAQLIEETPKATTHKDTKTSGFSSWLFNRGEAKEKVIWLNRKERRKTKKRGNIKKREEINVDEDTVDIAEFEAEVTDEFEKEVMSDTVPVVKEESRTEVIVTKPPQTTSSVRFIFRKIPAIKDKCNFLYKTGNILLAGGNKGLYEIKGDSAQTILKNADVLAIEKGIISEQVFCGTAQGAYICNKKGKEWSNIYITGSSDYSISSLLLENKNTLWLGSENRAFKVSIKKASITKTHNFDFDFGAYGMVEFARLKGKSIAYIAQKEYTYNQNSKKWEEREKYTKTNQFLSYDNKYWHKKENGWESSFSSTLHKYLPAFSGIENIIIDKHGNFWGIDREKGIFKITISEGDKLPAPFLSIISFSNNDVPLNISETILLEPDNSSISIKLQTTDFHNPDQVRYSYKIEGMQKKWSSYKTSPDFNFDFLPPGNYTILFKSTNIFNKESNIESIKISIAKPFTSTTAFYILIVIGTALLVFLFMFWRSVRLKKDKRILEFKVRQRTKTIEEQNTEITAQRDSLAQQNEAILQQNEEIEAQRDEIEKQRDKIAHQNLEITQSITYAKKIQSSLLPHDSFFTEVFKDHFILFEPRDIVSGDFYWATEMNGRVAVMASDCTGHGVPGAFMSMLGISILNKLTEINPHSDSASILFSLRDEIVHLFSQSGSNPTQKDGMDGSLCIFDFPKKKVYFAGAYNPLILIRDNKAVEYKADRMPIGLTDHIDKRFVLHEIDLKPNDCLYMFSDGYPDQFGGPNFKKFKKRTFVTLLEEINAMPMNKQKKRLLTVFNDWKGEQEQIDDVLVIGLKV